MVGVITVIAAMAWSAVASETVEMHNRAPTMMALLRVSKTAGVSYDTAVTIGQTYSEAVAANMQPGTKPATGV